MDLKDFNFETLGKEGLTSAQVEKNRQIYGENKLPEKKLKTWVDFLKEVFEEKINGLLLIMFVLFSFLAIIGEASFSEPIGLGLTLTLISFLNIKNNLKSQKSTKELKDKTSIRFCNVIRNGVIEHINTNELVVGDSILIESGESIYADGFLVEGKISVDNSVLNGESKECKKSPIEGFTYVRKDSITGSDYIDQNSLFSGTTILSGKGRMIGTNVGANTVNGKTILTMEEIEDTKTSLQIQIDDLVEWISKFGFVSAVMIVIALLGSKVVECNGIANFLGLKWDLFRIVLEIVLNALSIVVAAVPEGLPFIISLITGINSKVMLAHNVLAKNTNKIPEAGNIQLLCTDKTGTLTKGILQPVYNVNADGNEITDLKDFKINVVMNSSAMFSNDGIVGGNATERALLSMVSKDEYDDIKKEWKVLDEKPFNSAYKYSAVRVGNDKVIKTFYKGAPERILAKCTNVDLNKINKILEGFTNKAMRVIATAESDSTIGEELPDEMQLISLVAIRDDVRPEVPEAVRKMHKAGVQVMMVTGDVLTTAKAIAEDAGLITSKDDLCMSAEEFEAMSDEEAKDKLKHIKVVSRATPNTKLRIVKLAQDMSMCVGMTGDGTNDAPALKGADVGFSMGSGTDVCKEAGDIIITDDNFVSIVSAVHLGRTFMHNVLKFLKFQLPINISLVVLSIIFPLLFGVEAVAPVQILLINIVMDSLNSLSFGGEPAKHEYMLEQPIPKGSKLLNKETLTQITVSTVGFLVIFGITCIPAVRQIFGTEEGYLTARFVLLVIMATLNGFNIRTDSFNLFEGLKENTMFIKVTGLIFICVFILVNFVGAFAHCVPLNGIQWLTVLILSLLIFPIDLTRKLIVNKIKK